MARVFMPPTFVKFFFFFYHIFTFFGLYGDEDAVDENI